MPTSPTRNALPGKKPASRRSAGRGAVRLLIRTLQFGLLVLASSLMLLLGWITSSDFERRAIATLEALIEGATQEASTITAFRLQVWPPGVEVDGFHLHRVDGGDTLVSAERIRVPLVLRDGGPAIGRVVLQRPVVQLRLDEQGRLLDFAGLRSDGPSQPGRRPTRLPWSSLEIRDGNLRLSHPEGHLRVEHVDVRPLQGSHADLSMEIDLAWRDLQQQARIELPGVVLGPDRVEIPDLSLDTGGLRLAGRAAFPLGGELDVDLTARLELDALAPLLEAPRAVRGALDLDLRAEGPPEDPRFVVALHGRDLAADLPGNNTPVLHYTLDGIAAALTVDSREVHVEKLTLWSGARGELTGWGRIDLREKVLRESQLVGHRVQLAELLVSADAAPTPWVDMQADLEVAWSGSLDPLKLEGPFELVIADLQVGDRPIADPAVSHLLDIPHAWAEGILRLESDHVLLDARRVHAPRTRGKAVIDIGFGSKGPLDLRADLFAADLSDFQPLADLELRGTGRIVGSISGPFDDLRVDAHGDVRGFSVLGIPFADRLQARIVSEDMQSLELRDAVALRGVTPYEGDFRVDFGDPVSIDTELRFGFGTIEDLVGMFIDLDGLSGDLDGGTLKLHGPLFDLDGEAHLLLGRTHLWGERFSHGEGHGYMDSGVFTLDDLRVLRQDGREGLVLRGSVEREWALDMELLGDGFAVERMDSIVQTDQPLSGRMALHSRIRGTLFEPEPEGRISVTDLRYAGNAVDDSHITFSTTEGVLTWRGSLVGDTARAGGTIGLWGEQPYRISARLQDLPAHVFYPLGADGSPIFAEVSGELELSGHFGETWSPVTLRANLPEVEVRYGRHTLRNVEPWVYQQDGDRFEMREFNLAGGPTRLHLSASKDDELILGGQGRIDLDLMRAIVPGLQRANGVADLHLHATGSGPQVEAVVDIDVEATLMRHESVPVAFEDFRARIRATDERILIEDVTAAVGGGSLEGSGVIEAANWMPVRWDLSARISDAQVQWVDSLPPAIGDARLRFDGPNDALLLHGRVRVREMDFADRIDWEDWLVEYREEMLVNPATLYDQEPWFNLDVQIVADRTIRLRNNVAEGTASADLRVIGDTVRPGLVGTVRVDDALAFLQDREFRVERGNILFNDPWTWDPEIDLSVVTDILNRDQRYRVDVGISGPLSNWRSTARSDPPLPQADVNALLWFGITTEDLEASGELSSAVAQGVADLILTDFLITNQAGEIAQELPEFLFDRIDLATGVNVRGEYSPDPRLLIEKRLSQLGGVDVGVDLRWEMNLVRPEDNYVRADKRIGGVWSLSGWYATLQRDRVLPIGGAYGVDVSARWETD